MLLWQRISSRTKLRPRFLRALMMRLCDVFRLSAKALEVCQIVEGEA